MCFLMSRNLTDLKDLLILDGTQESLILDETTPFKAWSFLEHPKHERFPKPCPLGQGAHRAFDYYNFFLFCDFVSLPLAIGFFAKKNDLIKGLVNIGLLAQCIYLGAFFYKLVTSISLFS